MQAFWQGLHRLATEIQAEAAKLRSQIDIHVEMLPKLEVLGESHTARSAMIAT